MDQRLAAELELAGTPDEELVERLFRLALRRPPDAEARTRALARLADGTLSRATLLHELVTAAEFERVRALDDAVALARWARAAGERPRELRAPPGDERPVEIPWVLARYRGEPRVLDAGYAFAEPAYLAALTALGAQDLVGVDLAEAEVPGLRSVRADLRELPFGRRRFDVAFCISTLEHVGRDNTVYGLTAERDPEGMRAALKELRRVAARTLVTVPAGERQELDRQLQLEPAEWLRLFRGAGFLVFEHEVYELGPGGWEAAGAFDPGGVRYGERGPGASAVLCAELHPATVRRRTREAVRRLVRR